MLDIKAYNSWINFLYIFFFFLMKQTFALIYRVLLSIMNILIKKTFLWLFDYFCVLYNRFISEKSFVVLTPLDVWRHLLRTTLSFNCLTPNLYSLFVWCLCIQLLFVCHNVSNTLYIAKHCLYYIHNNFLSNVTKNIQLFWCQLK